MPSSSLLRSLTLSALLLPAAGAAAQSGAELEASEALWRLGQDSSLTGPGSPPPAAAGRLLLEAHVSAGLTASAHEPRTSLTYDVVERPRLGPVLDFRTGELLQPAAARQYATARVSLHAEWEATDWLLLQGLCDSGQIRDGATLEVPLSGVTLNGSPALDALRALDPLRELSATLGRRSLKLEVGRFRTGLADGLVFEGFGLGAQATLDLTSVLGWPLEASLSAVSITDRMADFAQTPLTALRVEHALSSFDSLGLFGAVVWDRDGSMSDVLRSAFAQRLLDRPLVLNTLFANDRGSGHVLYAGADAQLSLAPGLRLKAAAVLGVGRMEVAVGGVFAAQERTAKLDLLGGAANAELRYDLGASLELTGYAFVLSGDDAPKKNTTYHAFISPAPYWIWTGLFFSGGLNQSVFSDRAALGGIHGHGVLGVGPGLAGTWSALGAELRAIWLQALAAPPAAPYGGGGTAYGLEIDVRAQLQPWRWAALGAELDTLFPGAYFPRQSIAYRALALLTFHHAK